MTNSWETRSPDHRITRSPDSSKFLSVAAHSPATKWRCGQSGRHLAGWARYGVALLVNLHAQGESHGSQDLLDLIQRLAAKVLGLEHLRFCLLHQLANGLNVGVLQAVIA